MEKLISSTHFEITNGENILYLNQKANEAKARGEKVINGTVGMLFNEEGHVVEFPLVNKAIESSTDESIKKYGLISGSKEFSSSIMDWLFSSIDYSYLHHSLISTFGATGALALSIRNYTDRGQGVLLPSVRWSNYDSICEQAGASVSIYNLFDKNNKFDIDSLEDKVNESIDKWGRVFLLINDPCQNPTGYTLENDDWDGILNVLVKASKKAPIVLLDDIAYLNYSKKSYDPIFNKILKSLNDNFMVIFAFSASKTLSIYGLRGGAAICFSTSKGAVNDFTTCMEETARSVWSAPNNIACRVIEENFKTKENREYIRSKLDEYRNLLIEREEIFAKEAKEVDLKYYPYESGFYVLIPCKNNKEVVDELIKKNIFVVPLSDGIRVALSCLKKDEIVGLAKNIKDAMTIINR